ncbi:hypothetical protein ACQKII_11255 [Lysinibacillus sp. NPDC048646]|uniref:hypothetical protein n=1 Tax=Lysinibacillus sp. NPDC048646 TaxID=3390574 RepID=UPI003D05C453
MKFKIFTILFCIMFLSGCMPKVMTFSGENENWEVQFEVSYDKIKNDKCGATSGYIRYIGDKPIPKQIEYTIDHDLETSGLDSLDKNGVFTMAKGCSNAVEGTEVEIKIKWDNQSETIPLKVK